MSGSVSIVEGSSNMAKGEQQVALEELHGRVADIVKMVANEPSVGLFYVQQHVQRAVPIVLSLKAQMKEGSTAASYGMEDVNAATATVRTIKETGPSVMAQMLQSLEEAEAALSALRARPARTVAKTSVFQRAARPTSSSSARPANLAPPAGPPPIPGPRAAPEAAAELPEAETSATGTAGQADPRREDRASVQSKGVTRTKAEAPTHGGAESAEAGKGEGDETLAGEAEERAAAGMPGAAALGHTLDSTEHRHDGGGPAGGDRGDEAQRAARGENCAEGQTETDKETQGSGPGAGVALGKGEGPASFRERQPFSNIRAVFGSAVSTANNVVLTAGSLGRDGSWRLGGRQFEPELPTANEVKEKGGSSWLRATGHAWNNSMRWPGSILRKDLKSATSSGAGTRNPGGDEIVSLPASQEGEGGWAQNLQGQRDDPGDEEEQARAKVEAAIAAKEFDAVQRAHEAKFESWLGEDEDESKALSSELADAH